MTPLRRGPLDAGLHAPDREVPRPRSDISEITGPRRREPRTRATEGSDPLVRLARRNYETGDLGASVRRLAFGRTGAPLTAADAHETLLAAGFWPHRIPIFGNVTRSGDRQWRSHAHDPLPIGRDGPSVAVEHAYVHPDGGVVRVFTSASPVVALDTVPGPWARKSVLLTRPTSRAAIDLTLDREAFAVTDDGTPVPKSPRAPHGLKRASDPTDGGYDLARSLVACARIPLAEGAGPPPLALSLGSTGLARRFTIVPSFRPSAPGARESVADFWSFAARLEAALTTWPVLPRVEGGTMRFFFAGSADVARRIRPENARTALASFAIHEGGCVLGVEPFGYDASVADLAAFCAPLFDVDGWRVIDDASGDDVTSIARHFPHRLFGPNAVDTTLDEIV